MSDTDAPQLYLITPPDADAGAFPERLAALLDTAPIACLRLELISQDYAHIARVADAVRDVAHQRDVPVVITDHLRLVGPHGLDGVHLSKGAKSVRDARKEIGADGIVGAFCGSSRHDGINAGEAGADYVAFGPVDPGDLGIAPAAPRDLFEWWSEMIELPCIAEGGLSETRILSLAPVTDFFALGPEIWEAEAPEATLKRIMGLLG